MRHCDVDHRFARRRVPLYFAHRSVNHGLLERDQPVTLDAYSCYSSQQSLAQARTGWLPRSPAPMTHLVSFACCVLAQTPFQDSSASSPHVQWMLGRNELHSKRTDASPATNLIDAAVPHRSDRPKRRLRTRSSFSLRLFWRHAPGARQRMLWLRSSSGRPGTPHRPRPTSGSGCRDFPGSGPTPARPSIAPPSARRCAAATTAGRQRRPRLRREASWRSGGMPRTN
jgi:hypothetical protein